MGRDSRRHRPCSDVVYRRYTGAGSTASQLAGVVGRPRRGSGPLLHARVGIGCESLQEHGHGVRSLAFDAPLHGVTTSQLRRRLPSGVLRPTATSSRQSVPTGAAGVTRPGCGYHDIRVDARVDRRGHVRALSILGPGTGPTGSSSSSSGGSDIRGHRWARLRRQHAYSRRRPARTVGRARQGSTTHSTSRHRGARRHAH